MKRLPFALALLLAAGAVVLLVAAVGLGYFASTWHPGVPATGYEVPHYADDRHYDPDSREIPASDGMPGLAIVLAVVGVIALAAGAVLEGRRMK